MSTQTPLMECTQCLCLASRKAARAITAEYDRRLRPFGIRATQFTVLVMLTLMGPTPLRELAKLLGMERTTLIRNLDLLDERGLTESGVQDGQRIVSVTDAGKAVIEQAYPSWRASQTEVAARVGEEGAEALRRLAGIPMA